MLLYNYTNNFQKLANISEFTKKMAIVNVSGEVNQEIAGDPLITVSSELGDYNLVSALVKLGANVNSFRKSKYALGNTALIEAARYGYSKIVKLLIENGADINQTNYMGNTALMYASANRHLDCVKELLEQGANVEIADINNDTPLLIASAKGYFEIVEILLKQGANVLKIDYDNEDAFMLAYKCGSFKIVELLKKYYKN